ncbi:unnamed protein product (macronuclear) [Paramecium tetraurelia]|uniref:RING-type domain-containing protein n=1 Tax=Paramecium tetraurelia TaxID=5888 RepID=A0CEP7_PARTE|nr:uncharacterized protein GSPATT00037703001 [Paramecium tetraurelia]CAK69264.1 unnamed protein product [Paramecium tetraurelia]|eukprot:XP_001436661.1 hypothetical protein (macronuclear) [Paramecium tetraurelia strain d4-2]
MAIRNSHYFKLQSNNLNQPTQFPLQLDNKNMRLRQPQQDVLDSEYRENLQNQQQQIKLRSISTNEGEQITKGKSPQLPQVLLNYYHNLQLKQEYENEQIHSSSSKWNTEGSDQISQKPDQNCKSYSRNQPKSLSDQIDIVLKQQRLQYKQIEKQNQYYQDILKKQQLELSCDEFRMPEICTINTSQQIQRQRPTSNYLSTKNTSLNCTQSYFVQPYNPICYYCKSEIQAKPIKFICFHSYHYECLSEMVLYQIEQKQRRKPPQCLCGQDIKQQILLQLPQGQQFIRSLMQKQIKSIFEKYQENLNKCPNCEFRFIQDYRLGKQCFCPNCERTFKIQ